MLFFNCRVIFDDSRTAVLFSQMSVRTQLSAIAAHCKCRHPNQCGITAILTFFFPTNFHFIAPPSHNNSLLSDYIPFCPFQFSLHFCSLSILEVLPYSTSSRDLFRVSSDVDALSCAMGQTLSFGF